MTPRALLFVPADRDERFEKAARAGADAIVLDCEDAVDPAGKAAARKTLRSGFAEVPLYVRVNAIGTAWHKEDLDAVAKLPGVGIMLPKAEAGPDLAELAARPEWNGKLIALVETVSGIANARAIAATPGVLMLAFGSIDFSADCGCAHTRQALVVARSELVMASRLAGKLPPVDGVTTAFADDTLAEDDALHAAEMGFGGKLCIHPRQVLPVRRGFQPSESDVAWARTVLSAGSAATSIDGKMVDVAVQLRARRILGSLHDQRRG